VDATAAGRRPAARAGRADAQQIGAGRAGRYVAQVGGYAAFVPTDLPPAPPVAMDDELWAALSDADRALGRLDGSVEALPNPDLFVVMYVRKEAVLSSQIEGTQASLIDVLEFEAQALEPGRPQDVAEVVNYVAAMNHGLDRLETLPVSLRLIREIHERLLRGVRGGTRTPGEFRTSQNWIGAPGATLATATFVPPSPADMDSALTAWEAFLHDPTPMPALIKVGLAHAQFETIHPFLDGNGRTGRLLITFLLCERRILHGPLLYLSHYFKQHRDTYYERLQAIRDEGDWEGWLTFFLRGVAAVAQEATDTARRIVALREQHRELLTARLGRGAGKGLQLLEGLYHRPIVSVPVASELTGLTFANANTLVKQFTELRLLGEITGRKRGRRFAYHPYLDLLAEREPNDEPPAVTETIASRADV
jgi:cell filamentation protein, protein adenylyltransferase